MSIAAVFGGSTFFFTPSLQILLSCHVQPQQDNGCLYVACEVNLGAQKCSLQLAKLFAVSAEQ